MLAFLIPFLSKFISAFNIGSVFESVWPIVQSLVQNIIKNWKIWLIAFLVLLQVGGGYAIYHEHSNYVKEVAAHKADNSKFIAAQAAANQTEQNIKQQLQTESKAAKHEADTNYNALLVKYNASLMRYSANKSGSSSAGDNQLSTPQSVDGPGADAYLPVQITISGSDAEICAVNTARLQAAHEWALQQLQTEKDDQP